jgi:hypothetical protein
MRNRSIASFVVAVAMGFGFSTSSFAITNGGFEEIPGFLNWDTTGITSIFGGLAGGPTEGGAQARIETGDMSTAAVSATALETFLGIGTGSLAGLGHGTPTTGSAIKQSVSANAGDVLSFEWNFLTDEGPSTRFNDFSFVTFLALDTLGDVNSSTFIELNDEFADHTGFRTFSATIPSSGIYTLGLGVVHVGDEEISSGLLVDNIVLAGGNSTVPEPGTLLLFGSGLVAFVFWRGRQPA